MMKSCYNRCFFCFFGIFFFISCFRAFRLYGIEVDFVLDSNGQSYRDGFSNQFAVDYLTSYLDEYKKTMESMLHRWADTHALISVAQPAYSKRVEKFNVGLSIAGGTTPEREDFKTGIGTVDSGAQEASGFGSVLFVDLPSETVHRWLPYTFFKDTDVTIKCLALTYTGFEDVKIHMINAGIIFRRNIASYYTGSFGISYSLFKGKEDAVGLKSDDLRETVVIDENGNDTVHIDDPSYPNVYGKVHYPFIEARSLNIDAEIKQLWDYRFIQIILGAGFTINPVNTFSIQAYSDANVTATSSSFGGSESHDGRFIVEGTEKGSLYMPRLIVGIQINAGPVKIPIQVSFEQAGNKTSVVTTGLTLAF